MKIVLLFNARDRSYAVLEHDLDDLTANLVNDYLRSLGLPAFSHEQPTIHTGQAESCPACHELIEETIQKGGMK